MTHRTHWGTFTSRVHWKTFGTEALVEPNGVTLGCERYHWSNEVHKSHDAACRQRMDVLLCQLSKCNRNQRQRTLRRRDTIRQTLVSRRSDRDRHIGIAVWSWVT